MRTLSAFLAVLIVTVHQSVAADEATLYAAYDHAEPRFERDFDLCGDGPADGLFGYLGAVRVCADILTDNLRASPGLDDATTHEIVLLTSRPGTKTVYRVGEDRQALLTLANLVRPMNTPLTIRGQRGPDGRHLVWFKGLDLIDTMCDPDRVLDEVACREGRPVAASPEGEILPWQRRYEMTSLALVEEARTAQLVERAQESYSGVTMRGPRAYCVRLRSVGGIVLSDLAFEDCWLTAILTVNARRITVTGSRIHGSTFGMLALATPGLSAENHTFRVIDSHWIQSPGAYRPGSEPCDRPHLDLGCALDVWDDIPWGVAHHHIWRPLNGALFGAYNIAGNVLFADNVIERAFNGLRIISEDPLSGRNVTVSGNRFRFLRDNAVEPEGRAENWIIKHNVFSSVHAWISTDGVEGSGMYIFGNIGTYDPDNMPASGCSDDVDWAESPFFEGLAGDRGRYVRLDVSYDPTSVECRGHYRGTVLKTGDKRKSGFPYLDRISIFNNTWRTRSPIFSGKHASPLSHFNNMIELTGCGLDGPWDCRQIPAPLQYCKAGNKRTRGRVGLRQFWTDDGQALVADCASMVPGPAVPDNRAKRTYEVDHVFCRDLYNRSFSDVPYAAGACAPVFSSGVVQEATDKTVSLADPIAGCLLEHRDGAIFPDCSDLGPLVGAEQSERRLFDVEIEGAGFIGERFSP